ncbi:MAG: LuxR C-terminal-related transcriptional regulator [Robiginitomaculum sp.]|nr:LuxR C-terminal-related transcriptional regulator [Robiginitomaculum sp.]
MGHCILNRDDKYEDSQTRNEVVDWVYDAALRPENYALILKTWDAYIAKGVLANRSNEDTLIDTKILAQHFVRAIEVFEQTKKVQRQKLQVFLDEQVFASAIVSMDGTVLASNEIAKKRLSLRPNEKLYDLSLEPESLHIFRTALRDFRNNATKPPKNLNLRVLDEGGSGTLLVAEILTQHGFTDCAEDNVVLIKSCLAEWNAAGAGIIKDAFGYTDTEMEILELICSGKSAHQIAEKNGTKVQTVRWHFKNLLAKSRLNTRSELVRIVTGILHVSEKSPLTSTQFYVNWKKENAFQRLEKIKRKDGRTLQFAHYGHKVGRPILSLHDYTSAPIAHRALVQAMAEQGLQVIAPFKFGFGKNTGQPGRFDPKAHIQDCIEILDHLEIKDITIVGFGAGGINALCAADMFPERFTQVGLINVGAPLTTKAQYAAMPPNPRMVYWMAHDTPELLYAPQTFVADSYFASEAGKHQFLDLVFASSPVDQRLIRDKQVYKMAQDIIGYGLSDSSWQVDEFAYLFGDWEALFTSVSETTPIHFIHGQDHDVLSRLELEKFLADYPLVNATLIQNAARLLAYAQPENMALALKTMTDTL